MEKIDYIVIGVGMNTGLTSEEFPEVFRDKATSYEIEGVKFSRKSILAAVLYELEQEYKVVEREGFAAVLKDWEKLSVTIGQDVTVVFNDDSFQGKAVGIDQDGCLLVDTGEEVKRVLAGDVSIRPANEPLELNRYNR